jgi:hypothetical protein
VLSQCHSSNEHIVFQHQQCPLRVAVELSTGSVSAELSSVTDALTIDIGSPIIATL